MPSLDMYKMREPVEWNDDINKAKVRLGLHTSTVAALCVEAQQAPEHFSCRATS